MKKQIYIINSGEHYKVGISSNVGGRLSDLQIGNPIKLTIIEAYDTTASPAESEALVHLILDGHWVRGEWFKCDLALIEATIERVCAMDKDEVRIESVRIRRTGVIPRTEYKRQKMKRDLSITPKPKVKITKDLLTQMLTRGCGLPKRKALLLGLTFPPKRGWKKEVVGREIGTGLLKELTSQKL